MSSQNRGAQGTIKPKAVLVNTLFSGRNLAPGQRGSDPSRNGMQNVGKAGNVVRRMPPPASLPSLRAENNGQDPTTPVVPQGGAGWTKSDAPGGENPPTPTQAAPPVPLQPPSNDLRPLWLVAANAEQQANQSQAREFPSLAPPASDSDRLINKWENSSLAEKLNEMSNGENFEGGVPTRFLGSQQPAADAFNAKSVSKSNPNQKYNKISDDEGFDSQDRDRNYSTEEGGWSSNGSPSQTDSYGPDKDQDADFRPYVRSDERHFRTSEIRILKRAKDQLLLQDISDDEDEVQMTRLDKPSICVVKRGETKPRKSLEVDQENRLEENLSEPTLAKVFEKKKNKKDAKKKEAKEKKEAVHQPSKTTSVLPPVPSEASPVVEKPAPVEEVLPAPPPAENVWAKRQEERESLEREREKNAIPRVMQQAIEQHFPMVHESATMKVNKESTRKANDTEFTRAAIRARKQAASSDVRRLINSDGGNRIKANRIGNQENHDEHRVNGYRGQNGFHHQQNGFNGHNGALKNNQSNGRLMDGNGRERKDSHRSNISHNSSDKPINGHVKIKKEKENQCEKAKENGKVEGKKFNIEDITKVNIGSWADEMENDDGFEEVNSKKKKKPPVDKVQSGGKPQNNGSVQKSAETEMEKQAKNVKVKDPKQGTRLFVPKALRKEEDDLPANGLLSPQNVDTKEKIATAKNGDVSKKEDEAPKGMWDSLTPEVLTVPKSEGAAKKSTSVNVEFPKLSSNAVEATGYDFSFDPQLHASNPLLSDREAIQKMLSDEAGAANDDEATNRIKILSDLRQTLEEAGSVKKAQNPDFNETFYRSATNNVSLAPFSQHYSSFQPLFNTDAQQQSLLYPSTAPSPPISYLMNFSNPLMKRPSGFATSDNGLLGRIPNNPAEAVAAAFAAQQRSWRNNHFDINLLAGTPPANFSSNGSYGFFNNGPSTNEHRPPFGGLPNGTSNGMGNVSAPYFDRTNLPPANLAVGSQRQGNMFNGSMNRPQQAPAASQQHPMNNSSGTFQPPNFAQPPPGMMRFPPTNGSSHQDPFFFANGGRGPIGRPPGLPAPGHTAPLDMIWSNNNNNYFGNAGHSNGNWNGVQPAAGPPRPNGFSQSQSRDNQQMNNRMRRPVQGNRQ